MKAFRQPVLPAVILGFLGMAVLGWNLGGSLGMNAVATPAEGPASTRSPRSWAGSVRRLPPDVEKRLAPLRAARNEEDRMQAAIGLASTIPVAEIGAWLDGGWFTQRNGAANTLFHKILLERWKQEDPQAFFSWTQKNKPGDAYNFLMSFAGSDPQRALDFFKASPNEGFELNLLIHLSESHPDLVLRRLQEMGGDVAASRFDNLTDRMLGLLAGQDPDALEAALDSLPPALKRQAEVHLIEGKMATDFAGELEKLREHPDGLRLFADILGRNESLQEKLPAALADLPASWKAMMAWNPHDFVRGNDPEAWFRADLEAAGFSREQADAVRIAALGPLLRSQPGDALRLLGEIRISPDDRDSLLAETFFDLRSQPDKVAALLALLDSDEDKESAHRAMKVQSENSLPVVEEPGLWLEKVSAYDFGKEWPHAYVSMLESWEPEKIAALGRRFGSMPEDSKRPLARILALSNGVDSNLQGQAVRYLVSNVIDDPPISNPDPFAEQENKDPAIRSIELASNYIRGLVESNPDGAGQWLSTLPDGDARWWASKNLHSLWSGYDPEAADRWLKSLPEIEQDNIRQIRRK